jgi:hypothetical protein
MEKSFEGAQVSEKSRCYTLFSSFSCRSMFLEVAFYAGNLVIWDIVYVFVNDCAS